MDELKSKMDSKEYWLICKWKIVYILYSFYGKESRGKIIFKIKTTEQ